jgi:hypothetical protein
VYLIKPRLAGCEAEARGIAEAEAHDHRRRHGKVDHRGRQPRTGPASRITSTCRPMRAAMASASFSGCASPGENQRRRQDRLGGSASSARTVG